MRKKAVPVKEMSDSQLVTAIVRGKNPDLYREVVRRYQRKLFSYLYRLLSNKEEVEDVLQNVFVKTFRNLKKFDTHKKFSSWIYRIAHNEAVNVLKRRSRKQFVSWEDLTKGEVKVEARSEEDSPFEGWIKKESKEEVLRAIQELPTQYREVLILRYLSEWSYREIGQKLKKPVNTVGTLLNRARHRLLLIVLASRLTTKKRL
ncbi:RNA polymerase sigma factor [Patescibacteria group bacterium]|nr:MAG: RNA polymerase sigma factor [Patescibacteria group bacterium]